MAKVKVIFDGEGDVEIGSILRAISDSISALQQSNSIEKLTIHDFIEREAQRLLDVKEWEPSRD